METVQWVCSIRSFPVWELAMEVALPCVNCRYGTFLLPAPFPQGIIAVDRFSLDIAQ